MDIVEQLETRYKALTKLPEGRTPEEDKRIDEEIEKMVKSPENQELLDRVFDAQEAGDQDKARRLRREMFHSPDALVSNMLHDDGREFIKKMGFKLDTVEMKYGQGWLDKKYP